MTPSNHLQINNPDLMSLTRTYALVLSLFLTGYSLPGLAQSSSPLEAAIRHIEQHHADWGLTALDIADIAVNDQRYSNPSGLTHIYFVQRYEGIEVFNGILNLSVKSDGSILSVGNRFVSDLASKVNTSIPVLSAEEAIRFGTQHLGLTTPEQLDRKSQTDNRIVFAGGNLSRSDMYAQLKYVPSLDGKTVRLGWDITIEPRVENGNYWSMRVDATNGTILQKHNRLVSCSFGADPFHNHDRHCAPASPKINISVTKAQQQATQETIVTDNASYRVFPLPVESPSHGDRELVLNPADPIASPFGWHDVDGVPGYDYTITRGNNVYAFEDRDADQSPPANDVEGGSDLVFDFPLDESQEPETYIDASITNLFYLNNIMHDLAYVYGFDEEAGNFQVNNYGNGGEGEDEVIALGQFGGDNPFGNDALNNADFLPLPEGSSGRMRMFYWNTGAKLLEITSPANIAGLYAAGTAQFGPTVANQPSSGLVVEVEDPVYNPFLTDGCEAPFTNAAELEGNIALIDRGGCFFEEKVVNAEEAGAIAVIICNFEDGFIEMEGVADVVDPSIPSIMAGVAECNLIRDFIDQGVEVNIQVPMTSGPEFLSGDLDNGVVAHEYTHGISTRLTGGPSNSDCLVNFNENGEQMGEGWSDFLAIAFTVEPGDNPEDRRGVGTYVGREPITGKGFRPFPYSTDMDINPMTYSDIISATVPHGVGSVWGSMLWDLYWAMVDVYGWDPDLINGDGGNNRTILLVIEAMKIQPCFPGFINGRDAILAADEALYNGENQCLIWEVFARRGLGIDAEQGVSFDHKDGAENFDPLPTCVAELKIEKSVTDLIQAGENVEVEIRVVNHLPETATNVLVTDEIPDGLSLVPGSASITPDVNGNVLTFELGDLDFDDEVVITYTLSTPNDQYSTRLFYEDVEEDIFDTWADYSLGTEQPNDWTVTDLFANSGSNSFFVEAIGLESQQILQTLEPMMVQGDQPVLRFFHRHDTESGADGGFFEVSTDLQTWTDNSIEIFREPYNGPIAYTTFTIPDLQAWWGNSGGWIASYIDLSAYAGEDIYIRFRFGTNEQNAGLGWFVDDVELMDMVNYNTEACVTSDQGDNACAQAPNRGTVVDSNPPSSVEDLANVGINLNVFPNPTDRILNVQLETPTPADITFALTTLDGRTLLAQTVRVNGLHNQVLDVSSLPEGMYLLQVMTEGGVSTRKVVIR
jgi:extracellular elastinolytic metalloproteinase